MPQQRTASDALGRLGNRYGKPIGKSRAGDTRRDIGNRFIDIP